MRSLLFALMAILALLVARPAAALETFGTTITPDSINLTGVATTEESGATLSITNNVGGVFNGASLTNSFEFEAVGNLRLGAKSARISKGEKFTLTTFISAGQPVGTFNAAVKIIRFQMKEGTTLPQPVTIATIPIRASIVPVVQISPLSVSYDNVPLGTTQQKEVKIQANDDVSLVFTSDSPNFKISPASMTLSDGQLRNIFIILSGAGAGSHSAKIAVQRKIFSSPLAPLGFITASATVVVPPTDLFVELNPSPTVSTNVNPPEINFVIRLRNSGATSQPCEAQVLIGNNVVKTFAVNALSPNTLLQQEHIIQSTGGSGQKQVKVRIDSNNVNAEANETNNELIFTVNVP